MPSRITLLRPKEVSHVDKGANMRPYILVKADGAADLEISFDALIKMATEKQIDKSLVEDLIANSQFTQDQIAELRKAAGIEKEPTVPKLIDVSAIVKQDGSFNLDVINKAVHPLCKQLADAKVVAVDGKIDIEKVEKSLQPSLEVVAASKIEKAAPTSDNADVVKLQKALDDQKVALDKAATELATEKAIRLKKEFAEEAIKKYARLGGSEEIGGFMMKCKTALDADTFGQLEKFFAAANEKIDKGALFNEFGSGGNGGGGGDDPMGEIEKKAQALMTADSKLTKEVAISKAIDQNPELYKKYVQARGAN